MPGPAFGRSVDGSIEFAAHHFAVITRVKLPVAGKPDQRADPGCIAVVIAPAKPLRNVPRLGIAVPNRRFAVFCALIITRTGRDRSRQRDRTANTNKSDFHPTIVTAGEMTFNQSPSL